MATWPQFSAWRRSSALHKLLRGLPSRLAKLALAMIVARVIEPAAKLATARQLSEATAAHSLGAVLELGTVDEDELYAALDLLGEAQPKIETALAKRHLRDGCLVLYDLTSSYLEGRHCELGRFGYSRDGSPASCRSSSACSAPPMAAPLRWRCSTATPPIRQPWPRKSPN